ncbi:MAG TPA: response regulator [Opitutales bacterium]|nr:response regulator [Opitutales bacterium]
MSEKDYPDLPLGFEDLLAVFPDAVVVHNMENRVLYWNRFAESLYGWSAGEILGRSVERIFYLDGQQRRAAVEQLRHQGTWSGELRQIDREGHEHLVDVRQQLHRDEAGEPVAVLSFNRDITLEKKQADAAARAHHIQSSSLLAGGVAHELNNALAPIMLSSAMLKRTVQDEKSKGMVAMIEKCANKGADLITDLLAFERGKGGGNEVIRKTQILRGIQKAKEGLVPDNVELNVHLAEDLWEFRGEATELKEAYRHIMQNACEAMPDGGVLSIEVANCLCDENFANLAPEAEVGAYVSIAFKDTGFGIDGKIIKRVAEPFFTTKEPKQGSGFGLSNTQAIIKGHKGFMVLESERGSGTTLSLYIPADVQPGVDDEKAAVPEDHSSGAGRVVLVADDELFIRETIKRTLEDRGYRVLTAQDGTEALAVYAGNQNQIDVVVTNVEMPFMDGPALCRALKKLNPDVRILVSSGHKQREKVQEIKSCGVDQFLAKPYTADQLADRVRNIIEG